MKKIYSGMNNHLKKRVIPKSQISKKKIITTLFIIFFALKFCFSQDVITKKTGEDIKAKILEVGITEIKYKKFDNQDGPTFIILKSEILMVRYENGTKDIFNEVMSIDSSKVSIPEINNNSDNCLKGKADADLYHDQKIGNFIVGVVFGPFGIIGAALSSPKPKSKSKTLVLSKNKDLFNDPVYLSCYKKKARGMNVVSATLGWATWILIVLL